MKATFLVFSVLVEPDLIIRKQSFGTSRSRAWRFNSVQLYAINRPL